MGESVAGPGSSGLSRLASRTAAVQIAPAMSGLLQTPSRCSTGIAGLDEILHGGLPVRRLHLVQGEPGTGKTTLALQFLLEGVRRGEACLYVTLAESAEELAEVARSHGWSLEGLHVHALSEFEALESPDAQNTLFHPAEVELHDTIEALFSAVRRRHPARAVIDSLSELRLLSQNAWGYRRQVLGLKVAFDRLGCTTLLVDDLTATGAQALDRQVESVAHGVIALRRVEPAYGTARFRLSVRKLRGSDFSAGAHDYAIRRGGLVLFPRVLAARSDRVFTREPIPCGIAGIDRLLGGGLDRGTSTLVLGPAGAGKSTLALTFAGAVARGGERVALFAFEENLGLYQAKSAALGWDLADAMRRGQVEAHQVDPAQLSPGQFSHLVAASVSPGGARLVVIDSLNGYSRAMQAGEDLNLQLHELLAYLAQHGVTTLLVLAQQGYLGQIESPLDLTYLADAVVVLRYFEAAGRVRQAISVAKKRSGDHERTIRELEFTAAGLRVGEPLTGFRGVLTGVPEFVGNAAAMLGQPPHPEAAGGQNGPGPCA